MAPSSLLGFAWEHIHAQMIEIPPKPDYDFSNQTVIVTGSNVGIGLETARWFIRLGAAKVILAIRTIEKGERAAENIRASTNCEASRVEVWQLDVASTKSIEAFVDRARGLERLDIVMANAGVYLVDFEMAEENERTITVNVINTFLLAILLLPILRETSVKLEKETALTFTGSFVHWLTAFPEQNSEHIFQDLADQKTARMSDRYNVSKLIHLLVTREFASALDASSKPGTVITSHTNPGHVETTIMRNNSLPVRMASKVVVKLTARTADQGGRVMVHAAHGGKDTHGQYLSECKVAIPSPFIRSEESRVLGRRLWKELGGILEEKHPGIMSLI